MKGYSWVVLLETRKTKKKAGGTKNTNGSTKKKTRNSRGGVPDNCSQRDTNGKRCKRTAGLW